MRLSKRLIGKIEGLLDENDVLELFFEEGTLMMARRAREKGDIEIIPTLTCAEEHANVVILLQKPGEDPVHLLTREVPPGYYIAGIKGYISQEITEEGQGEVGG